MIEAARTIKDRWAMTDIIMLALVIVSFALGMAYAALCDQLLAPPIAEEMTP